MKKTGVDTRQKPVVENTKKGIDVSKWQEKIDWNKVAKTEVKHVYIKMTEGGTYVDSKFVENWKMAGKAGISVNCYHYFRAVSSSPKEQMANIRRNLKAVGFDPVKNAFAIDVKERGNENATPKQMAKNLNALLNLIKENEISDRPCMIYTSYDYWDKKVKWDEYNFSDHPLWVAHWEKPTPTLPQPWKSKDKAWAWWQYSAKGNVDGIANSVDLDWKSSDATRRETKPKPLFSERTSLLRNCPEKTTTMIL